VDLVTVLISRTKPSQSLLRFAADVGGPTNGAVTVRGSGTHWHLGGSLDGLVQEIQPPAGIVHFEPAEMIVRCGAGTTFAELDTVLSTANQCCPLDPASPNSTVGGLLAAGLSGHRRLRFGATRDLLLEAQFVSADGELLRAGAPVVKNVSGYDLCRLLVGSFGTLGLIGEVVLRCRPRPKHAQWYYFDHADPSAIRRVLFQPSSLLWDGQGIWALNEGHLADVRSEEAAVHAHGGVAVVNGPMLPIAGRLSVNPALLTEHRSTWDALGDWVAEIGVGTVHTGWVLPRRKAPHALEADIKRNLDPYRRLSPGRLEL
jgi:FAD/FMN-containing dehydrogenase